MLKLWSKCSKWVSKERKSSQKGLGQEQQGRKSATSLIVSSNDHEIDFRRYTEGYCSKHVSSSQQPCITITSWYSFSAVHLGEIVWGCVRVSSKTNKQERLTEASVCMNVWESILLQSLSYTRETWGLFGASFYQQALWGLGQYLHGETPSLQV